MQLSRSLIGTNVSLYFDNFFTTPSLIFKLKQNQICSCDTVRQNKKGMPKNLKKDKEIKKGELDRRHLEGIYLVKWMDTKGVIILSTIDFSMPVVPGRRRLKGQKKSNYRVPSHGKNIQQWPERHRLHGSTKSIL